MSHPAGAPTDVANPSTPGPRTLVPAVLEMVASLTAFCAMFRLLSNKLDASLAFLGESPKVMPWHLTTYHHWLLVLACAITLSFAMALLRGGFAARSLYWHGLVLVAGLASAALCHVAIAVAGPDHPPVNDRPGPVCYSGSGNCPGG